MLTHRNPQARLSKPPIPDNSGPGAPPFDVSGALDILREIIGRTDALVGASEDLLEQEPWGDDEGDERRAERLAHLLSAAREAARAAVTAVSQIADGLAMHRAVSA